MKERFEAPLRARKAEIESRMAALEPRIKAAYDRAGRHDLARVADNRQVLYRNGFAQCMSQDELTQLMNDVFDQPPDASSRNVATLGSPVIEAPADRAKDALGNIFHEIVRSTILNPLRWKREHQVALICAVGLGVFIGVLCGAMLVDQNPLAHRVWLGRSWRYLDLYWLYVLAWGAIGAIVGGTVIYIHRLAQS